MFRLFLRISGSSSFIIYYIIYICHSSRDTPYLLVPQDLRLHFFFYWYAPTTNTKSTVPSLHISYAHRARLSTGELYTRSFQMFIAPQTPPRALASYVEAQWPYTYNLTVALQRRAFKKSTTICAVKDYTERQRCEPKDTTSQLNIQELHRLLLTQPCCCCCAAAAAAAVVRGPQTGRGSLAGPYGGGGGGGGGSGSGGGRSL